VVEGKAKVLYDALMKRKSRKTATSTGDTRARSLLVDWQADPLETTVYVLRVMARRDIKNPLIQRRSDG